MDGLRFLFLGGGTGGHLAPAVGLAEALESRGQKTLFLVNGRPAEAPFLKGRVAQSLSLEGTRLPRFLALVLGIFRARSHAKAFSPNLVVALGGAGSVVSLGLPRRVPRVVLEGNAIPGKAVRLLQLGSRAVLTQFPGPAAGLKNGICVGPLSRRSLRPIPAGEARAKLGLDSARPTLLVVGGSQGADAVNAFAESLIPCLVDCGGQLLALVGEGKGKGLRELCSREKIAHRVLSHCPDMGAAYSAADLALVRGGAATIGELALFRLPSIVIPYPNHADRQQYHNASLLGGGTCVLDEPLGNQETAKVFEIFSSESRREKMRACLEGLAPSDGLAKAVEIIEEIASHPF